NTVHELLDLITPLVILSFTHWFIVNPGECPNFVPSPYFKPCADKCSNDYDCAYNEKCCYQGCGRTCVAIQQGKT
uniref:WAP domain-containing protein n=1 Tax=Gouania willdenowi TaxID=441366 RepID=A0A8C5D9Z6_GOUWI